MPFGSVTQDQVYEFARRRAYRDLKDKTSEEVAAVAAAHEMYEDERNAMSPFARGLANIVDYLSQGWCAPGRKSPEYSAAKEILGQRSA